MKKPSFFQVILLLACITPIGMMQSCQSGKIEKNFDKVFEGRLEQGPDLCMNLQSADWNLKGSYFYKENPEKVNLTGSVTSADSILINEFDQAGNLFGVFKGKFVSPTRIEGTWSKPDGSRKTPFFLSQTNFTYDGLYNESRSVVDKRIAAEEEQNKQQELADLKKSLSKNIGEYLVVSKSVSTDKKAKGVAGLKVSLKNRSNYAFDQVTVRVDYLDKKEQTEATETIVFTNLEAGGSQTKSLPDNKKAQSVRCQVTRAESSSLNFTYAGK